MKLANHTQLCSFLVLAALGAQGCQSQLTLRVEQVKDVASTRLSPDSRLGRVIDAAIADLNVFCEQCESALSAMEAFVLEFPDDEKGAVEGALKGYHSTVEEYSDRAVVHRDRCRSFYAREQILGVAPDIRATLRQVEVFFAEASPALRSWRDAGGRTGAFRSLLNLGVPEEFARQGIDKVNAHVDGALSSADPSSRPSLGFGGVIATDVYVINPSDPLYATILKNKLNKHPLTQVSVGVTGDSSIMVVMEHFGQFRVYQISNDPTQITRNIALVVSKATAAVARFAGGGLLP